MKVTLYNAISIDGFIATPDGNSDWVSEKDAEVFEKKCIEYGCIIVGRKTFEQYYGELYPMEGITNIVITTQKDMTFKEENVKIVQSVNEALEYTKTKNFQKVLLVGGGTVNGSFLKENHISEIILSVHPLILGNGVKIFQDTQTLTELELENVEKLDDNLVQLKYKVK